MVKVLIVDDELLVRVGLKSTIEWVENGFSLIGEARNSQEAISLFERNDPDIVIVDISMPEISGLELIEMLRKQKPGLCSIILTHHEDFEFAKRAISLGVVEYILKSDLTPERLLSALNKARKSLISIVNNNSEITIYQSKKEIDIYLLEYLEGRLSSFEKIKKTFSQLNFEKSYFLVANVFIQWIMADNSGENNKLNKAIEDVCNQFLPEESLVFFNIVLANRIIYLFNSDFIQKDDISFESIVVHFMNQLMNNIRKYFNLYLSIGLSNIAEGFENIPTLYARSLDAQKESFFEASHISVYNATLERDKKKGHIPDQKQIDRLITIQSKDQLKKYLDVTLNDLSANRDYEGLQSFVEVFIKSAIKYKNSLSNDGRVSYLRELDDISNLYDFDAAKKYLFDILEYIFEKTNENGTSQYSFIIKKCVKYIQEHYKENISLTSMAKYVEVSRSYLSFLFKQELNVNFSHYLINNRIENAKRLLLETNMKIYEIAENVGFDSPYYFSKVFKEITGKTCKDYRSEFYEN